MEPNRTDLNRLEPNRTRTATALRSGLIRSQADAILHRLIRRFLANSFGTSQIQLEGALLCPPKFSMRQKRRGVTKTLPDTVHPSPRYTAGGKSALPVFAWNKQSSPIGVAARKSKSPNFLRLWKHQIQPHS